jgi:hypothetical protein
VAIVLIGGSLWAGTDRPNRSYFLSSSHPVPYSPTPFFSFPTYTSSFVRYSSWPLKLLINACVFSSLSLFLTSSLKRATSALKGVCCHAEGATPFRLGCSRRKRHLDLCAYLSHTLQLLEILLLLFYRELYYRKTAHLTYSSRLTHHHPLPSPSSMVHQIPPSLAANIMACSYSPPSIHLSHQVSRSVAFSQRCWAPHVDV